jgi:hypothetical protein
VKYRRIVHIALVRLLCPSTEKKDKISPAHNQIDAGNLLSNVLTFYVVWGELTRQDYGADQAPKNPLDKLSLKIIARVAHYYSLKEK